MSAQPKKTKPVLEKEKLELEIQNLSRLWILRTRFWTVLISAVFVGGSLFIAWRSGILDREREALRYDKLILEWDIRKFTDQRDSIFHSGILLQDSLYDVRDSLQRREADLIASIKTEEEVRRQKLQAEQDNERIIDFYEAIIDSLTRYRTELEAEWRKVTADNTFIRLGDKATWNDKATWDDDALSSDGEYLSTKNGVPIRTKDGRLIMRKY